MKDVEDVGGMLVEKLPVFLQSSDLEVQERVSAVGVALGVVQNPLILDVFFITGYVVEGGGGMGETVLMDESCALLVSFYS